ncbi:MAG: hypothetical protein J6Z23_01920 [Lachnospiraceae bacterium]|nr:hypothetical protein [Lachnospiraceae bacterium]
MKKGTGFILAVLLAVMLVPQAVYGANPADSRNIRVQAPVQSGASGRINITEAEVTIGIPSDGMVADFNAIIPWYADYYISDVQWYDENDQRYLVVGSGDKYMEGHSYTVSISLTADDGYQFAQDVSVNFNYGLQAETRRFANISDPSYCFMLLVRYTFVVPSTTIRQVEATITPAVAGAVPQRYVEIPTDANYHYASMYWYDATDNRNLGEDEVFQAGHFYAAHIILKPDTGYKFGYDCEGQVNGVRKAVWVMDEESVRLSGDWTPASRGKGWYQVDGYWFYNDTLNHPLTGSQKIGGNYYLFNDSGAMLTGMQYVDGTFKYYDPVTGARARGWTYVEGYDGEWKWHYADAYGVFVTGWRKIDGKWYYFDYNSCMVTDMQLINGKYYRFNSNGAMTTGWWQFRGSWFYFGDDGAMVTGWKQIEGEWYYFSESGVMAVGWITVNGKTYYFKKSGAMAHSEYYDGLWLNADGSQTYPYQAQWKENSKGWWYGDASGWYAKNGTYKIDGKSYTFDKNGYWIAP